MGLENLAMFSLASLSLLNTLILTAPHGKIDDR